MAEITQWSIDKDLAIHVDRAVLHRQRVDVLQEDAHALVGIGIVQDGVQRHDDLRLLDLPQGHV